MRMPGSLSGRRLPMLMLVVAVLGTLVATAAFAWFQGYRLYVVQTGSMSPTFDAGDVVIDRSVDTGFGPGDVLTVQISAAGDLVTHRMTRQDKQGKLHTKGDANKTADAWALSPEQVRGVVDSHVPKLGYLIVFLRQPAGIAGVMTSAMSIFLLWGLCFPAAAVAPAKEQTKRPTRLPARLRVPLQRTPAAPGVTATSVLAVESIRGHVPRSVVRSDAAGLGAEPEPLAEVDLVGAAAEEAELTRPVAAR